ncbi:MAG: response regulator [Magnetococcales bacterium]|nr:response regulator [Magnetococcales bacterium]
MPTILVVDAVDVARAYLSQQLIQAGFQVEEAINGIHAMEKIISIPVAMAMVDINLPKMDGLDLVRQIRQQPSLRGLPVLVMSVAPRPGEREAAMRAGANLFRAKPIVANDVAGLTHLLVKASLRPHLHKID